MVVIGITGNSGSGKSLVCRFLIEKGAFIIDADEISRNILVNGEAVYNETIEFFGAEILFEDGRINRKKLGEIIFADVGKREKLEEITHKYIKAQMIAEVLRVYDDPRYNLIVLDVPLLVESGLDKMCHRVWVVDAPHDTKVKRIIKRDNISVVQAEKRLAGQTPFEKLMHSASDIILNIGDEAQLRERVDKLITEIFKEYNISH